MDSLLKGLKAKFLDDSSSSSDDNGEFSYKGFKFRPKKKRRNDAGRRCQKGITYDSSLGITCHFCRQKTTRKHVYCRKCVLALCGHCLQNRHGEDLEIEVADDNWLCPMCRGGCGRGCKNCCNCTFCRKKLGLRPPKFAAGEMRARGFDNVHDYLIHLETGESASVISARKLGKGWCSSSEKNPSNLQQGTRKIDKESAGEIHDIPKRVARRCKKEIDADFYEKSWTSSDRSAMTSNISMSEDASSFRETCSKKIDDKRAIDDVKAERLKPSKDAHGLSNNEKQGFAVAVAEITRSEHVSQGEKAHLSFPEQFRSKNEFVEKLERRLAQPFDPQELKELWAAVTCRKSQRKVTETDLGVTSFSVQNLGQSYIHHYPDLAQKYMRTGEEELKLRLLRSFFFWLEHGSMPGSFKPWTNDAKDDECLELNGPDCQVLGVLLNVDKEQQKRKVLPNEADEDDVKPDMNNLPSNRLPHRVEVQSKLTFNWDEEDIKPKLDLLDWRASAARWAGRS